MRPATLAEAYQRLNAGVALDVAFSEFLDTFYLAGSPEKMAAAIAAEPPRAAEPRHDAQAAAAAQYLAQQYKLDEVPAWCFAPWRTLKEPWFTAEGASPGVKEFLWFSSPGEFRSRNIFTEERPLRRASRAKADRAMGYIAAGGG